MKATEELSRIYYNIKKKTIGEPKGFYILVGIAKWEELLEQHGPYLQFAFGIPLIKSSHVEGFVVVSEVTL